MLLDQLKVQIEYLTPFEILYYEKKCISISICLVIAW